MFCPSWPIKPSRYWCIRIYSTLFPLKISQLLGTCRKKKDSNSFIHPVVVYTRQTPFGSLHIHTVNAWYCILFGYRIVQSTIYLAEQYFSLKNATHAYCMCSSPLVNTYPPPSKRICISVSYFSKHVCIFSP